MWEYINNGDVLVNNIDKNGYGFYEIIWGLFDFVVLGN